MVWGHASPEKFEISKLQNAIFSVVQNKLTTKERVFHSRKCSFHSIPFDLSVTKSVPMGNEQMMKTKLPTFACEQILRKPLKKLVKN